ncbi:MAG: NADH-quinone oxidoreductase subunit L [Chloroflexi bacterium]|nr:MAG: NADH-quinone oxidoreductase subunit L [Chloroflexota bacterium]
MIPEAAAWAIYFVPLIGAGVIAAFLRARPLVAGRVMILAIGTAWLLALWALNSVLANDGQSLGFKPHSWLTIGTLHISFGIGMDGLTGVMLVVVTSVALLVQVYSTGYMHGDGGYARYFAYMGLFTSSMLGLVLASSLLQLFIFWELVGVSSYLLIGFWFDRPAAAAAAKKAFIVTRFGDFGFMLAVLLIWTQTGEFNIATINEHAEALSAAVLTGFTLGLFAGAVGKSAQFPLHIWLPDAMEGPTPVSALIHAATMVAAGVYLIARFFPAFEAAPPMVHSIVAWTGAITALLAATMGLVATDVKRVLAYSTISQLGYMVLALGLGGYVAAIFHLFTHAFFKALLFLGSGSVNHATGTFDMRKMGGLRSHMPITFWTFVIGSLSLSGVFPLAGFWSKDEVLHTALLESPALFALGAVVAFMTACYMFRAIILTFLGTYAGGETSEHGSSSHHGPHESPASMVLPLIMLSVPAIAIGWVNLDGGFGALLEGALPAALRHGHHEASSVVLVVSTVAALGGIATAFTIYFAKMPSSAAVRRLLGPLPMLAERKYFMDDIGEGLIARGLVYGGIARACAAFDTYIVDGVVNGVGSATRFASEVLRRTTWGQQQAYSSLLLAGVLAVVLVLFALSGNVLER